MTIHTGIITGVHRRMLTVNIKPEASECGGCALTSICKKNEEIEVAYTQADPSLIGRGVTVGTQPRVQLKGIALFFAIPIVLLIAVMAIALATGLSEGAGAVMAITFVGVWYFTLYLMRIKIKDEALFKVIRID